jgi:signal peptidase I
VVTSERSQPRAGIRVPRWALAGVLVLAVLLAVRAFVLTPVAVHGVSMEPSVHDGTALVARWTDPAGLRRGQLVVFRDPQGALALKRVVGVAGDDVAIRDAVLEVDDRPVREPYVDESRIDGTYFGPVRVPPGTVFVMGDNRAPSIDSRVYGPIAFNRVLGRVLLTW